MLNIANREIDALRQQVPPPDQLVFRLEKEEMLRGLEVYYYLLEEKHVMAAVCRCIRKYPWARG